MRTILPPALQPGDTIGVMAPSGWIDPADLDAGKEALEDHGYRVYLHPQATQRLKQMAGTPLQKAAALHDLFASPDIKAVICARGGNRSMGMLPFLDFRLMRKNPKALVGFSDATALLQAVHGKTGLVTYHGPVLRKIGQRRDITQMIDLLGHKTATIDLAPATCLREGKARGVLIGGNLSLLQALIGTPYEPDWKNAILFIEDTGDQASRYDRMLMQMKLAGVFNKIAALIVGDIALSEENSARPFGYTIKDMIVEHTAEYDFPILIDAPFGHGEELITLPVGQKARLEGTTLTLG